MDYTLQSATQDLLSSCNTEQEELAMLDLILKKTRQAMYNSTTQGGIVRYSINTGQTVINVQQASFDELLKSYQSLKSMYNELVNVFSGSNMVVVRDFESNRGC